MSDYFGCCPICGKAGKYVNVQKDHFHYCKDHKVWWWGGSGMFSSWRDEDEETWRENAEMLGSFIEVEALHPAGYMINGGPVCHACVQPHEQDQTPRQFKIDVDLYRVLPNPPLCERCGKEFLFREAESDPESAGGGILTTIADGEITF